MKMHVILDHKGHVLGTARVGKVRVDAENEIEFGLVPEPGQTIHEIEIPEEVLKREPADIHREAARIIRARPR